MKNNPFIKGILKKKSFKTVLIVCIILILFAVISITGYAKSKSKNKDKAFATMLLPDYYSSFIYVKNFKKVKKQFLKSDFAEEFKNNYIFLDFKYKYYQNVDLFFIKLNFNIEKFLDLVKKDILIGNFKKDFFVIASINYKSKIIYSIFNLMPDAKINETSYKEYKIYYVYKMNRTIYYSIVNNYLVVGDRSSTIKSIIDAYKNNKETYDRKLHEICTDEEVYFKSKINTYYNKYDILPNLDEISLKINFDSFNIDFYGNPSKMTPGRHPLTRDDYEVLKYFSQDLSLLYFNKDYSTSDVLSDILNNYQSNAGDEKTVRDIDDKMDILNYFKDGAYFVYKDLGIENMGGGPGGVSPQFGMVIRLNEKINDGNLKKASLSMRDVIGYTFGIKSWEEAVNEVKKYIVYYSNDNEFSLIAIQDYFIISNGTSFTEDIVKKINAAQPSLYDRFYDNLGKIDYNTVSCFSCVNIDSLTDSIEPVFYDYIAMNLNLNNDEYDKSFGQLFDYLKKQKDALITINYNKDDGFYGKIEYID